MYTCPGVCVNAHIVILIRMPRLKDCPQKNMFEALVADLEQDLPLAWGRPWAEYLFWRRYTQPVFS